jgi:hypothetical protein
VTVETTNVASSWSTDLTLGLVFVGVSLLLHFVLIPLANHLDPKRREKHPGGWEVQKWLLPGGFAAAGLFCLIGAIVHR